MKHLYLYSLVLFFATAGNAQVLNLDKLPDPGNSFPGALVENHGFEPGSAGENVTWDFSDFAGTPNSFNYTAVSNDPVFTGSEMKLSIETAGDLYFKKGTNEFFLTGTYSKFQTESIPVPYSDPQKLFSLPMHYHDSLTDNAGGQFNVTYSGLNTVAFRKVKSKTVADATGKVLLPGVEYDKVLRIKVASDITDSVINPLPFGQSSFVTKSTMLDYYFFDENTKHQIVYMTRINVANNQTIDLVFHFGKSVTGVSDSKSTESVVYPNPATSELFFRSASNEGQVKLFNMLGEEVHASEINAEVTRVDVSGLSKGLYHYEISNGNQPAQTGRVVVH